MVSRLFRVIGTALIVVAIAGISHISPASAAIGDDPDQAEGLQNQDYTTRGQLQAGKSYWYFVDYPGGGVPLGITLHLRPEIQPFRNQVELNVNVRNRADVNVGDKDKDGAGVSRIGALSSNDDSGAMRKFWLNFSGDGERYFLRLNNFTDRTLSFIITVQRSNTPASYMEPPVPTMSVAPPAPAAPLAPQPIQPVPLPVQPAPQPVSPVDSGTEAIPPAPVDSGTEAIPPAPVPLQPVPPQPAPVPPVAPAPAVVTPPFITGGGTNPSDAEMLQSQGFTKNVYVGPGQAAWFRVDYFGNNLPLGITLLLRPTEEGIRDSVTAAVNVRTRASTLGENDKDWPGFTRLGALSQTDNSGTLRKFWFNSSGDGETYYLRVSNNSDRGMVVGISVQRSADPASYVAPQDPLPFMP